MRRIATSVIVVVAIVATGVLVVVPHSARAKLTKRDFCAVMQYCRIPARFRKGPFLAKPIVHEVSLPEIRENCTTGGETAKPGILSDYVLACARMLGDNCVVYVPSEVRSISQDIFDMVLEHELAHCRGWQHGR